MVTASIIFDIKTVLKEPVKLGAQRLILIHNHPSGDPTPSKEDIAFTKRIAEAGKELGIAVVKSIRHSTNCTSKYNPMRDLFTPEH